MEIGSGSYGHVYKVNESTALKKIIIRDTIPRVDGSFIKECNSLMLLKGCHNIVEIQRVCIENMCQNIYVKLYDFDLYGFMAYISRDIGKIFELTLKLMNDMAVGLTFIHCNGLMHRDIKPNNILVKKENEQWNFYIADFGSCIPYCKGFYYYNNICNTGYAQPELDYLDKLKYSKYTQKIDVWCAGKCFFDFLSIEHTDNTIRKSIQKCTTKLPAGKIESKKLLNKENIPNIFCDIIDCCLEIDPTSRISSHELYKKLNGNMSPNDFIVFSKSIVQNKHIKEGSEITQNMLLPCIEWIIKICRMCKKFPYIALLSIDILYRVLTNFEIKKNNLQNLASACMVISDEFDEHVDDCSIIDILRDSFNMIEIHKTVVFILESLNYVIFTSDFVKYIEDVNLNNDIADKKTYNYIKKFYGCTD